MPVTKNIPRRQCIPIVHTTGTHYDVGYDVGRTFSAIIKNFLQLSGPLNEEYLPLYGTPEGRKAYEETLSSVKKSFPQYIDELQGTADGAGVEFHKLFLLHMDDITPKSLERKTKAPPTGCSTIIVNEPNEQILGHTEDALAEVLNHYYFVSAHIKSPNPQGKYGVVEEKFTSLCYAGHLPGYTMNYNHHGLVFSINTLSANRLYSGKTPRHFITRALLSADSYEKAVKILRDSGVGAGDGCSINMTFLKEPGDRVFYNTEMAPADGKDESQLNIRQIKQGDCSLHCNKYLRLNVEEVTGLIVDSSNDRMDTFCSFPSPKTRGDVVKMLGDTTHKNNQVFREGENNPVLTVCVGIFDCIKRTWTLYADNPKTHEPLVTLNLELKEK